jgi:predicted Zn-dependent protease
LAFTSTPCGLKGEELRTAYVSLGGTYCSVGRFGDAARILQRGAMAYPDAPEFDVFLALTRYHLGDHREAMRLLLSHIAEFTAEPATQGHKRAISYCAERLDQVEEN